MEDYLESSHYDLVTPDGKVTNLTQISDTEAEAIVFIDQISPVFVGFEIDSSLVFFNMKSTLAQVGIDGIGSEYQIDAKSRCAQVKVLLKAIGPIGKAMLPYISVGSTIGKLFAADDRRRVRDPEYLSRMFGRSDRWGKPLLSLGGYQGSTDLILDKVDGRTVAYLSLQKGQVIYSDRMNGFLPTLGTALKKDFPCREMLKLVQEWDPHQPRNVEEEQLLLVRTMPLHIRTVFGRVVDELLSEGYHHTTASILQPDTTASGDIYELYGSSVRELTDIPLEFYTLEPYREYVFFSDRDQLQEKLEDSACLFKAFDTAPDKEKYRSSTFIVKSSQLERLTTNDWIQRQPRPFDFPGTWHSERQGLMVERYIEQQAEFPFLKAINDELITSQGILLSRYLPSPLMKRMLIGNEVQRFLKAVYFQYPSKSHEDFFSAEDRAMLHDLEKFAIPIYWVDIHTRRILRYVEKPDRDSGMFVPVDKLETFIKSTMFGIYGSNLLEGHFEHELQRLIQGVLEIRGNVDHPLLSKNTPIALVTGGGPGAMEVGNRVAKELGILSCANIVDFRRKDAIVNEQRQNPYVEAKMTYRLDKLVERQAEFNLDFPIFVTGGIGTDFEYTLEEVRRKVGSVRATPILLFGEKKYWQEKITSRFRSNLEHGTIQGSEWISNCFYCVQTAEQGIQVYKNYFSGTLPIGKDHPYSKDGFVTIDI
ncbi:MAG: hypothetical protein H7A37_00455 [Chlamydiales bacterium]|nr:hypothetical protein [Chlamydiia bacterium]MCP5506764.1 hypothetical protein [Chlamydiales bacterium]